jgi:hypothetical protein
MLDPTNIFSLAGLAAMVGWIGLITALFVSRARLVAWPAAQLVIPALLAILYVLLLWQGRSAFDHGGFGSLYEVRTLFADDNALAAGWLHYLGFDLFVGAWVARDGTQRGVPALLILPCLPLIFLFGPAGLLLYVVLRLVFRRSQKELAL